MYLQDRAHSCENALFTLSNELNNYGATENLFGILQQHYIGLIDLKSSSSANNNLAVLEECEHGEEVAVIAYQNLLREKIPDNRRTLLNDNMKE